MTTLITRLFWMVVSLLGLDAVVFFLMFEHTADVVQAAVDAGLSAAAVSSDTDAVKTAVTQNIQAALPVVGGRFDANTDVTVRKAQQDQEVNVTVTYHMPILAPIQRIFGLDLTMPITRGGTQALDYLHNGLQAVLTDTPPDKIGVVKTTLQISGQKLAMYIQGYGFGAPPNGVPGTTTGDFLTFEDTTQGWQAGSDTSGLAITYGDWKDNEITITGIENFGRGTEVIRPGDECRITVNTANGSTTYYFVANPSGDTQYSVTLGWKNGSGLQYGSATVPVHTPVTWTASSSVPGDGTNGVGIYDTTTGQYLIWSGSGDTVTYLVNSGTPGSHSYVAYYGPQGQIDKALAVSDSLSVTWTGGSQELTAVMYPTSDGGQYIDIFGPDLTNCVVSGTGLSNQTQISANEVQVQAASANDITGVVRLSDGTLVPFTAEAY
ncbi:hypothetical protein [Alicyclobacillus macrosporangiidus]|uniref:Uncharacterized protein n=1 Tax=Alicyclobacillus macrosporangiidus TaxID=392015 RepID=A0A1I7KFB7_9BACL|nr:hypothetical protein [Alicyclobacillus macrosporangiidus]SFU96133.1 hypothetical protein SAMN05421543_11599 [Alicyclobacillus macrosporangiidus]